MPIQLPNLDDVSWKDLNEEARSLIPGWAPSWTNHNASDPGITLVELFAYLTEGFIYRINRVGDENIREFLKLISGGQQGRRDFSIRFQSALPYSTIRTSRLTRFQSHR